MSLDAASAPAEWPENELPLRRGLPASGASVVGLWLLVPLALSAAAFFICGVVAILVKGDQIRWGFPAVLAAVLVGAYWCVLAHRVGRVWAFGLWGVIPVVGLLPTFTIARDAAADVKRHVAEYSGVGQAFCPSCGLNRRPGAFCRGCGYDFLMA